MGTTFDICCSSLKGKKTSSHHLGRHRRGISLQTLLRCFQKCCAGRRGKNFLMRSSVGSSMWSICSPPRHTCSSGTEGRLYLRGGQGTEIYGVSRLRPTEEKEVREETLLALRTVQVVKTMQVLGSPCVVVAWIMACRCSASQSLPLSWSQIELKSR